MPNKRGEGGLIQAGEIPALKSLSKKFAPPTRAQLELVEVAATIREQPDAEESGRRRSRFRSEADQDSGGKPISHSGAKPISDSGLKAISNRPRAEW